MDSMCRRNAGAKIIPEVFSCQQICVNACASEPTACRMRAASTAAEARDTRECAWTFGRPFDRDRISGNSRNPHDHVTTESIKARFDAGSSDDAASKRSILLLK